MADLLPTEAAALGPVLQSAVAAIERVVRPERVYVASYGERVRHRAFLFAPPHHRTPRRSRHIRSLPPRAEPVTRMGCVTQPIIRSTSGGRSSDSGGPCVETVEHLIVGAGPAGLRAAQVLSEAGREVLVLEKRDEIGPKTCAGGLTPKAVRELDQLGLPEDLGLRSVGHVAFSGGNPLALDGELAAIRTIPRRELGRWQVQWARAAGAEVCAATPATELNPSDRTLQAGGRRLRWRHLIGADGSDSIRPPDTPATVAAGLLCRRVQRARISGRATPSGVRSCRAGKRLLLGLSSSRVRLGGRGGP